MSTGAIVAIVIGCICLAPFVVGAIAIICEYAEDSDFFDNKGRAFTLFGKRKSGQTIIGNNVTQSGNRVVTVNGKTFTIEGNHKSVSIINGKLYVDGKLYVGDDNSEKYEVVQVVVNGNVGNLDATTVEVNGDVSGSINGTTISVTGNVGGDIDGTTVTVGGSVNGDIDACTVSR